MTALTASRKTDKRAGDIFSFPVAAATTIYQGSLVALDASGNLIPAEVSTTITVVGRANEEVDNSAGAAAALNCEVEKGVFKWVNGSSITKADIGYLCWADDDQTVSTTSSGKAIVGTIVEVESDGVWVEGAGASTADVTVTDDLTVVDDATIGGDLDVDGDVDVGSGNFTVASASGDTVVGGSCSITGAATCASLAPSSPIAVAYGGTGSTSAADARTALGLTNKHVLQAYVPDLVGANAYRAMVVAPVAGTISSIRSVLLASALATGDATLTGKINGTGITDGVVTITQSGSAVADADVASPSALNVVAAGDVVEVTVGGTNDDATAEAMVSFEITEG